MIDSFSPRWQYYSLEDKKMIRDQMRQDLAMRGRTDGFGLAETKALLDLEDEIAQEQAALDARRLRNRWKKFRQERRNR